MENVFTGDLLRGTILDSIFDKPDFVSRKVKVRIIRREGGWLPPSHEAAVMMKDSKRIFVVPRSVKTQQLVNPLAGLTEDQLDFLAGKLGLEDGKSFNIYKKDDENYWINKEVMLTRDGDFYDLGRPDEFIKWCILRTDTDKIAPSWDDRFMKGTYQFALMDEHEEMTAKLSKADKMKEAWRLLGRLESQEGKMRDFLYVYFLNYKDAKKPPKQANAEFLKAQLVDVVENFTDRFLELATDPDYDTKILIHKGIEVGGIYVRKHKYFFGDDPEPIGNLQEMIDYLDDDEHQQERLKIKQLIQKESE